MLGDLLTGLEARQPQAVANMTVIPLVSQAGEVAVGTLRDIYLEQDPAYNRLVLATESAHPTILPLGYTLITRERAQDRAVATKSIIPGRGSREVPAYCVQSSQCGHMARANRARQEARMLPLGVRRLAFRHRDSQDFRALWDGLAEHNRRHGVPGNFLSSFFEHFQRQLQQFVAEFELVQGQRGAVVLINDRVEGVEVAPSPAAFAVQWEPLIRDCYGAEAVGQQAEINAIDGSQFLGDAETFEELRARLEELERREREFAGRMVAGILGQQEQGTGRERQREGPLRVLDVETAEYEGQVVREDGSIVDLTLLRRGR
jgi:hypothetical protein